MICSSRRAFRSAFRETQGQFQMCRSTTTATVLLILESLPRSRAWWTLLPPRVVLYLLKSPELHPRVVHTHAGLGWATRTVKVALFSLLTRENMRRRLPAMR